MKQFWTDLSVEKIEASKPSDFSNWIGVLPLGAHEQHGAHLPFETDSLIAGGVAKRLADKLPEGAKVVFLPVEEVGYSPEHLDYAGSKSLSYQAAIERWIGIGEMLHGHGLRKLMLLNAHGGNSPLMTIVATELRVRFSMLVVATSWTRFGTPEGLIDADEVAYGIHGGDIETSVMMALRPELVNLEKFEYAPSYQEQLAADNQYLRAYGKHSFGWKMQDLNHSGVVGDAQLATAEKGEKLLAHSVDGLHQLVDEMARFDIEYLDRCDDFSSDL